MAEMGIPTIAASRSAPMYRLERITATGSIGGGPLAAAAPSCWLTSGTAPVLGLFESAIRCSLPSDRSDEAGQHAGAQGTRHTPTAKAERGRRGRARMRCCARLSTTRRQWTGWSSAEKRRTAGNPSGLRDRGRLLGPFPRAFFGEQALLVEHVQQDEGGHDQECG